jgi:hypothetical protein
MGRARTQGGPVLEPDRAFADAVEPDDLALDEAAVGDDEPAEDDKGKRRPFAERIAEIDDRIEWLNAEKRRLELEWLAARAKAVPHLKPQARRLRAFMRAGLHAKADTLAAVLIADLASFERKPTGPDADS